MTPDRVTEVVPYVMGVGEVTVNTGVALFTVSVVLLLVADLKLWSPL